MCMDNSQTALQGRNEMDRESVQTRKEVHVGVLATWREAAECAGKVKQVVAFSKVTSPVLKFDDGVRVLVEELLRVVFDMRASLDI